MFSHSAGRLREAVAFTQEKVMPRLQGKSSNAPAVLSLVFVLIAAFVILEYFGVINLIPDFGRP